MAEMVEFIGIIRQVSSKALVSLDKSYRILIETENGQLMEVGTWPGDETVKVTVQRMPKGI